MHSLCIKVVKSCKEVCKLQFLWKLYTGGGIWILSHMILSIFSCICEGLRIQWTLDVTNTGRGLNVTPIAGEWCPASSCPFHWQRTWVGKKKNCSQWGEAACTQVSFVRGCGCFDFGCSKCVPQHLPNSSSLYAISQVQGGVSSWIDLNIFPLKHNT